MIYTSKQIQQAKSANLLDIAIHLGLKPIRRSANGIFFENPFREDRNASFSIFKGRNGLFFANDFGTGEGVMDGIALVQKIQNIGFQDAVKWLLDFEGKEGGSFSFTKNDLDLKKDSNNLEIRKIQPLKNKILINYLKFRKINTSYAMKCPLLHECYYRVSGNTRSNGQDFFALAFQNIENGYDLRSSTFKGKYGKNNYSYISHHKSRCISVFEGFTDYLTALTYYKVEQSHHHILILNSTENRHKAVSKLQDFDKVFLFLDNDEAGHKTVQYFQDNLQAVFDQSHIYQNHNDFNAFIFNYL